MVGTELALFIMIGALSILAAVMMLISENAVHSALFLIVNFACVAFLYLMLSAPFLFAVQITVYAGAIMVLFLFVIMLMGAERVLPQETQRFPWLSSATLGITMVLLFVAGLAIIRSDLGDSEPKPSQPIFRFVHAVAGTDAVDVYINGERVVSDLEYREASDFEKFPAGSYTAQVIPHNADLVPENVLLETPVFLAGNGVISYVLTPDVANGGVQALQVEGRIDANDEKDFARLTVVHAIPCAAACPIEVADITEPSDDPQVLVKSLEYGQVAHLELQEGDYTLAAYNQGDVRAALDERGDTDEKLNLNALVEIDDKVVDQNTGVLWVVTQDTTGGNVRPKILWFALDNNPDFGSAEGIGQLLFTDYLLPFEVIGLLLLTAMVGVIVLTKQHETPKKERFRRRMANVAGNPTVEEYMQSMRKNAADSSGD
ncbi:MAG: NADH-quinone oxidoreductase subunit J [Chloroflexi bacterium]|nr:NADH-quinone oxidoreductase subunit J [Chloroflexota bacterium]